MIELLSKPWPWYVAGILIGLTVPLLLLIGNKSFGISSTFRHICAAIIPNPKGYFNYNWKNEKWNLLFVLGILIGGVIASTVLKDPNQFVIADGTKEALTKLNVTDYTNAFSSELFSWESLQSPRGFILLVVGGFLVGFGTRYAGGCTSGHAIMGLANLQWPSLIATICFMVGGFIATWFILPFILTL